MEEAKLTNQMLLEKTKGLEVLRKKARNRLLISLSLLGVIVPFSIAILINTRTHISFWILLGMLILYLGALSIFFTWAYSAVKKYKTQFKEQVVREIILHHNPEWTYSPDSYIPEEVYANSELFKHSYSRYNGDDYIIGIEGKTRFAFSELHTQYKTQTNSNGSKRTQYHTIFKGLFLFADFNKAIKGKTFVFPDTMQSLLGKFGQKLQSWNHQHGKLVKLEDQEFEKHFVVYSDNQIEARYILTPKIMENLVAFRKKWGHKVFLSFIGTRMYFAVSMLQNLFEPRIFSSGMKQRDLDQMKSLLALVSDIIQEMDLNTRIWTVK
ncbi:MAG: hypothetical protein CR997_07580 [Acidobacteria bacterium]|nr:MAG: hypothetical protein CR997_07580 [Acidobacteriota bacterium]